MMKKISVSLEAGTYIVAVSGGVDSMVMLDILHDQPDLQLIVAHFDHGIRSDSDKDRQFVREIVLHYGLPFVSEKGELGSIASEANARAARYGFLEAVRQKKKARAIVTAHHEDDVLETAVLNLLRGTGRKGLASLSSQARLIRPMVHVTKHDIFAYAKEHGLQWREDPSNTDERYLRNYIRHRLLPRFSPTDRARMLNIIKRARDVNGQLDAFLAKLMQQEPEVSQLDRLWFSRLDHAAAKEYLASWLRCNGVRAFDSKTLERVVVAAKVGQPGSLVNVIGNSLVLIGKRKLALVTRER